MTCAIGRKRVMGACFWKCLSLWRDVLPVILGSVPVGWHLPWLVLLSIQINGVDMTEARHDQAVALLTGTSPTISLVVERDPKASMGSPGQSRARAHSPPPPEPSDSPDQEEEGLQGNHLGQMEDEYPIEVRALYYFIVFNETVLHSYGILCWSLLNCCPLWLSYWPVPEAMVHGMMAQSNLDFSSF